MIVIDVSIRPHGDPDPERLIRIEVTNTMNHPRRPELGNYRVVVLDGEDKVEDVFEVRGHIREHGLGPLVKRCVSRLRRGEWKNPADRARFERMFLDRMSNVERVAERS